MTIVEGEDTVAVNAAAVPSSIVAGENVTITEGPQANGLLTIAVPALTTTD